MNKKIQELLKLKKQIEETEIDLTALKYVSRDILFSLSAKEQFEFLDLDSKRKQTNLDKEIKAHSLKSDVPVFTEDGILAYYQSRIKRISF
jgi:hypothetical protein